MMKYFIRNFEANVSEFWKFFKEAFSKILLLIHKYAYPYFNCDSLQNNGLPHTYSFSNRYVPPYRYIWTKLKAQIDKTLYNIDIMLWYCGRNINVNCWFEGNSKKCIVCDAYNILRLRVTLNLHKYKTLHIILMKTPETIVTILLLIQKISKLLVVDSV